MRLAPLLLLALSGCAALSSTRTAVTVTPPDGSKFPAVTYASNKEQHWTAKFNPETGAFDLTVDAPNSPGMTGEDMAAVVSATAGAAGTVAGSVSSAIVQGVTGIRPPVQVPVAPGLNESAAWRACPDEGTAPIAVRARPPLLKGVAHALDI